MEQVQFSPFDRRLQQVVGALQTEHQQPVVSRVIAEHMSQPVRTVRYYLRRLESKGGIHRPAGKKSGYSPYPWVSRMRVDKTQAVAQQLSEAQADVLRVLLETDDLMPSRSVARALDIAGRTARYHLNKLEGWALVERPAGCRSGYAICDKGRTVLRLHQAEQRLAWLSDKQLRILQQLIDLERLGVVVQSAVLSGHTGIPHRTVRYHLKELISAGYVQRPRGWGGGYAHIREVVQPVMELARERDL